MKSRPVGLVARLLALVAFVAPVPPTTWILTATEASAQIVTDADRCREDLAGGQRRYVERVLKARLQCETKLIGSSPTSVNCLTGRGDTMLDRQLRKAEDQLSNVGGDCGGVNLASLGFPGSCSDLTGSPFDTEDFKACVVRSTSTILTVLFDYYYPPIRASFSGSEAKCLSGSARDAGKSMVAIVHAREDCLVGKESGVIADGVDCRREVAPYGPGTGNARVDEDISRAYLRLLDAIPSSCARIQIHNLNYQSSCVDLTAGTFTIFDLKKCLFDVNRLQSITAVNVPFPVGAVCGDGIANGTEQCDLGTSGNSDTKPNTCRTNCKNPVCGDHVTDTSLGEQCDDANSVATDGCNNCQLGRCGDGNVVAPEECDNGDTLNSDTTPNACRKNCTNPRCGDTVEDAGEECDLGTSGNSNTQPNTCRTNCKDPKCHDGVVDSAFNETCDDGNSVDNDCCTNCHTDVCGDGVRNCAEQCDNGVNNSNTTPDACRTNCKNPKCADNVVDTGEECDDGNTANCDDCSALCLDEFCGDGVFQQCRGEECDNGVDNADAPNKCRTNCKSPRCPDGIVDVIANGEDCDDGNTVDGDACRNTCAVCGNNKKAQTEECDGTDNTACLPGEGCTSNCDCLAGVCPTKGELVLYAGVGDTCSTNGDCPAGVCDQSIGHCRTSTRLDSGWLGAAHDADINNGVHVSGLLNCPGHGPTCGLCNVVNVDASTGNCRCGSIGGRLLPGQGNQEACGPAFQAHDPDCPQCENAATKNRVACASNTDCIDNIPQCNKAGRLCLTDPSKVCTTTANCPAGGAPGANLCPPKVCSNDHLNDCASNVDCNATMAKCQSLKCSNDTTKVCATNTDCTTGVCNGNTRLTCSTTGSTQFCAQNSDCFIRGTCSGTADCNCYFGAPFPLSSGGTPACVLNRFSEPISGTANVDLGSGSITASLRTVVYIGESGGTNPCPTCGGKCSTNADVFCDQDANCPGGTCINLDPTPNDGLRGGFCTAGLNKGTACDVTAFNTTFPAFPTGPSGSGYSLDCFPTVGKNISGTGLVIDLTQTTGTSTLESVVNCQDQLKPNAICPCLVCSGDQVIPCHTDADCTGIGTCSAFGSGAVPNPNACNGDLCTAQADGTGVCTTGPDEFYCEGVIRANGKGLIPCNPAVQGGCQPPNTDGDFGQCTLSQRRLCFPDPIVATGTPSPSKPIGAATFCIPPTDNSGINNAAGLPGAGRVVNQATAKTFCGIDTNKEYVPGVGGCFDDQ